MRVSTLLICCVAGAVATDRPAAEARAIRHAHEIVLVADSVRDFSNTQGAGGWFYGFWDRSADEDGIYHPARDFRPLPRFGVDTLNGLSRHDEFSTGPLWYLEDGRFYTSLWAGGGHAHGEMDLGRYASADHWVVRRWVSSIDAEVEIRGRAGKTMPWGENWGGEVVFRIEVGDSKVYEAVVDDAGEEYSVTTWVENGTTIDFLTGPGSAIGVVDFTAAIRRKATGTKGH